MRLGFRKRLVAVGLLLGIGMTQMSTAFSLDSNELAVNLGSLLAAEEFCELSYDQDAIAAFIDEHVDADDLGFPSTLRMMTEGSKYQLDSLTESEKTAHCRQITRAAKSHGFLKD